MEILYQLVIQLHHTAIARLIFSKISTVKPDRNLISQTLRVYDDHQFLCILPAGIT
jgi:hypothetical protein